MKRQFKDHASYWEYKRQLSITTAIVRFWTAVQKTDECWLWLHGLRKGYGKFQVGGKVIKAHAFSWELHNGRPVPEGLQVLHTCDNPRCVRPEHLFLGTQSDNIRDAVKKGRMYTQSHKPVGQSNKTHCSNGHPFSPENTYVRKLTGHRGCRTCRREFKKQYIKNLKEGSNAYRSRSTSD